MHTCGLFIHVTTCDIDGENHILRVTRPPLCVHTACDHGAGLQPCLHFSMTVTIFLAHFYPKDSELQMVFVHAPQKGKWLL